MRRCSWSWLVKSKLPIGSDLNQITVNKKMSNSFIADYTDQYIVHIGTIPGFKIFAIDCRLVLIQLVRIIYDGVDTKVLLGNNSTINGKITKLLAGYRSIEQSTYHSFSLPT